MDDEPGCGKGLAHNAALPAKLAELLTELANTLQEHRRALDLAQPAGRAEDEAYARLVDEHRQLVARLSATAQRMEGYRTLPTARHDPSVMSDSGLMAPYVRFLDVERELIDMLQASVKEGEALLRPEARGSHLPT